MHMVDLDVRDYTNRFLDGLYMVSFKDIQVTFMFLDQQ